MSCPAEALIYIGQGKDVQGRTNLVTGWAELVISISRSLRLGRRSENALSAITSLAVSPDNSTPNNSKLNHFQKLAVSSTHLHKSLKAVRKGIAGLKRTPRLMVHGSIALFIIAIVITGSLNAKEGTTTPVASQTATAVTALSDTDGYGGLIDETASAFIAAGAATQTDLPIADEVTKQAEDLSNQTNAAQTAAVDDYLQKPQMAAAAIMSHELRTYTVAEGDTVDSIAQKFNLTADTVRWANNLTGRSQPKVGQQLTILPVNGVLHTVASTDTPEGLAVIYRTTADQIVSFNDAEVSGLKPGQKIVIPNGVIAASPQTPTPTFSNGSFMVNTAFRPTFGSNGYDYGYCTWYSANRRMAAGKQIPSNWGNASSWYYNAMSSGYKVGNTPVPGAVAWEPIGGLGHVAYVESVNPDGSVNIAEMNRVGWGRESRRTTAPNAFRYIY